MKVETYEKGGIKRVLLGDDIDTILITQDEEEFRIAKSQRFPCSLAINTTYSVLIIKPEAANHIHVFSEWQLDKMKARQK